MNASEIKGRKLMRLLGIVVIGLYSYLAALLLFSMTNWSVIGSVCFGSLIVMGFIWCLILVRYLFAKKQEIPQVVNQKDMKIKLHPGGVLNMRTPQKWTGENLDTMQVARFAGEAMIAITDDAGGFDLIYMGFTTGGFKSIEEAKFSAPEFAKMVLEKMLKMIDDSE